MTSPNIRISSAEHYDPKQRFVGGIVLFVLMLLLYAILKAVLGISSTGAAYALPARLPDEMPAAQGNSHALPNNGLRQNEPPYPMFDKFVFLGLDGRPMESPDFLYKKVNVGAKDGKWYVQVASFRQRARADNQAAMLAANGLRAGVSKAVVNGRKWYVVKLASQPTRKAAKEQQKRLKALDIKKTKIRKND